MDRNTFDMSFDIETKTAAAQTVTTMRRRLKRADLVPFVTQAIAELRELLRGAGIPESGDPMTLYHAKVGVDDEGDVEVCVPCEASRLDESVIERREIPAATVAYTTIPSDPNAHEIILAAHEAIAERILHDGYLLGEVPREIYHAATIEIAWPFARDSATALAYDDVRK